jgi:hypothetical protein
MQLKNDFLGKIIATQQKLGHKIFTNAGEVNIVYIEGCDLDGKVNSDRINEWNDVRLVYRIQQCGTAEVLGKWKATSEPGTKYTDRPLNPLGAFRIAFGQYKAWVVGQHHDHEALVQLWEAGEKLPGGLKVGELRGFRDLNKDGFRKGDKEFVGTGWGVNQHGGYDMKREARRTKDSSRQTSQVDGASAGCLVGQTMSGHREFMDIIKKDVRCVADRNYVFWTSILDGSKLESVKETREVCRDEEFVRRASRVAEAETPPNSKISNLLVKD